MDGTEIKPSVQAAESASPASTATPSGHPVSPDSEIVSHAGPGRKFGIVIGAIVVVVLLVLIGWVPRILARTSDVATGPVESGQISVDVIPVVATARFYAIDLPGNIQAVDQTAVVARANGYVQKWFADIGDHVKTGQVLALIDTPDLDQQLTQAQAQLAQAQAAEVQVLANVSSLRAKVAEGHANVSRAEASVDEARTDLERAKVAVAHGQEAVARQQAQLDQAQAAYNLADVTSQRYQSMLADGAVDEESADQALASLKSSKANVDALNASLRAAGEDVRADQDEVLSSASNFSAFKSALESSRADADADEANVNSGLAAVSAAEANVRANQANVDRLRVMTGFNKVTAPFDGVITARNIDTGTLITANGSASGAGGEVGSSIAGAAANGNAAGGSSLGGSSSSGGGGQSSLYSIAKTDVLRVYINVPQADSDSIRDGDTAQLKVSALPGRTFAGTVARTADSLDPVSRTLVTEVRVLNPSDDLRPGMFADIVLDVPHSAGSVLIPDAALVTDGGGSQVQLVNAGGTVHYQPVSVGKDFGKVMEITSGLQPGQRIVASAMDSLREGQTVKVANVDPPPATSSGLSNG